MILNFRKIAVYLLKNYPTILFLYNSFFKLKNKKKFNLELNKRKDISIFMYNELSSPIPFYPVESVKDSNFYGYVDSIKKYSNIKHFRHAIEHGLYLGNYVPYATFLRSTKSIVTMSESRKRHLQEAGIKKPIYSIGPYIHYAQPLLSVKDFNRLKQTLGKTLLLFPAHSIKNEDVGFEIEEFINKVKEIAFGFDTVLTCLYYHDIKKGYWGSKFETAGFKIVTAGHQLDINFISRLKTIIQLSDYTISNTVGTHTGYCVYLNKPHFIIQQPIKMKNKLNMCNIININNNNFLTEEKEIMHAFLLYSEGITKNQNDVINKYWGISSIKQPEELKNLLN